MWLGKDMYSQTCDQQPPKGHDKTGCLRQVAADHKFHDLVGFVQVLSVQIILHVTVRNSHYITKSKLSL